ncbi:phosphatidate cytidylyltransferase [Mesorhizobium sp. CAU 1741]|uniref:phosphatidate cytidylyltransferase n=1 Tax=Mesorhizobium sp. CAU 1741 TaxID=3140366 RepID=UPI00325BCA7C
MAGRSNLQQRVLSAIVLVVAALLLTWLGGIWYRLLCAAIAAAVLYEWLMMILPSEARVHGALLSALLALVLILMLAGYPVRTQLGALAATIVVAAAHAAYERRGFWPVTGIAYAGGLAIALAALRGADAAGFAATLFLFAVVWATDILAYFVGRAIGGPKLAPAISPGKTWSGAIGGTVAGVVAGVLVALALGAGAGVAALVVVALLLSVLSQIGDLFESRLKRMFSVKDSSQLIPGHGGVMDRVDGLVAAAVALFVIGVAFVGLERPAHAFFGG